MGRVISEDFFDLSGLCPGRASSRLLDEPDHELPWLSPEQFVELYESEESDGDKDEPRN